MRHRLTVVAAALCLAAGLALAQQGQSKQGKPFRGKVEQVDEKNKTLTVNHERVEGWMEAMTMTFEVDNASVLKTIKVGDHVTATVYDGDYKLHNVKVVAPGGGEKQKK